MHTNGSIICIAVASCQIFKSHFGNMVLSIFHYRTCTKFPEFKIQLTIFAYNEFKITTNFFHMDTKLGERAYGVVYKVLLTFIIPCLTFF